MEENKESINNINCPGQKPINTNENTNNHTEDDANNTNNNPNNTNNNPNNTNNNPNNNVNNQQHNFLLNNINHDHKDKCPCVFIDRSGSTATTNTSDKNSILQTEIKIMGKILQSYGIDTCHIIMWENKSTVVPHVCDVININNELSTYGPAGGTDVSSAFHTLLKKCLGWLDSKEIVDIYIVTDGEINGDTYGFPPIVTSII